MMIGIPIRAALVMYRVVQVPSAKPFAAYAAAPCTGRYTEAPAYSGVLSLTNQVAARPRSAASGFVIHRLPLDNP
jgi:hypothetical protein